jgi:hypothetical protein
LNSRKRAVSAFIILILLLGIAYYFVSPPVKPTPALTYARDKGLSNDVMAELTAFDSDQTLNQSEVDFINYVSVFAKPLQKKLVAGFLSDGKLVSQETRQIDFLKQFPVEEQAQFIENGRYTNTDWDGDKMDNYFEQNIARLQYDVGNGRYALLVGTGRGSGGMNVIERFLISEEEFLPQNIINLSYENATMENFSEAVSDLSKKASENDIVCVCLSGQGTNDCFYFNDGNGNDKSSHAAMSFMDIDNYLDSIRPMKMLVTVAVSSSINAIERLREGSSPRVVASIEPHWLNSVSTEYFNVDAPSPPSAWDTDANGYVSVAEVIETATNQTTAPSVVNVADGDSIAPYFYLGDLEVQ